MMDLQLVHVGGADNYKSCELAGRSVEPASFGVRQGKETAVHIHLWYFVSVHSPVLSIILCLGSWRISDLLYHY